MINMLNYKETLVEVRRRLLALEDKRLGFRSYYSRPEGCYCAIGALAPKEAIGLGEYSKWNEMRISSVINDSKSEPQVVAFVAALRDLNEMGLLRVQGLNDMFSFGPYDRYTFVLREIERELAELGGVEPG